MLELLIIAAVGLVGGVAVGTQAPIAGAMGQRIGGVAGSFVVHVGGSIASGILLLAKGGEQIAQWKTLPWYMLGCGALGLVLYLTLSYTIPKLGSTSAIALVIVGQLLAGMVIDHFGAFDLAVRHIDLNRIIAACLLFAGAMLMIR